MNKKKLMMLPIVAVVVAMFGVSVLAASPNVGPMLKDADGNDVCDSATEITTVDYDLTTVDGLADKVKSINSEAKLEDAKFVVGYDLYTSSKNSPFTATINVTIGANEIGILLHDTGSGLEIVDVEKGAVSSLSGKVDSASPFLVYKIAVQSSSQTGEYATPYIVMISVALVACGAVFAVRAKKATK